MRRTRCGEFTIDEAVSPEAPPEALLAGMVPLDEALRRFAAGYKEVRVTGQDAGYVASGRTRRGLRIKGLFPFLAAGEMVRFTLEGQLLAIGEYKGAFGEFGSFEVTRALGRPAGQEGA